MITTVIKIVKALNSETGPWQLSFGVGLGMIMGLTPVMSVHNVLVLLLVLWCRVNLSFFLLSFGLFSGIAYVMDPIFHQFGFDVLNAVSAMPLWTDWYNDAFMRWTRFNNTVVMGSFVISLLALAPVTVLTRFFIRYYRQRWQAKLAQSPLMKWLHTTRWAETLTNIGGGS